MPDDAGRDAAFYDHENEPRRHVVDWGADDLFTRMPRRRTVHTPPPPRTRRPAPLDPVHRSGTEPAGRFERLDGEAPSAGDVLSSGRRLAPSEPDDRTDVDPPSGRRFAAAERRDPTPGARSAPRRTASTDGEPGTGRTDGDARVVRSSVKVCVTLLVVDTCSTAAPFLTPDSTHTRTARWRTRLWSVSDHQLMTTKWL